MKKKILIIITSLAIGGGAERAASTIAHKLSNNYDFCILTFYDSDKLYPFKGKYVSLKEDQTSFKKFLIPFKLQRFIKKYKPDLILSFMDHTNMISILTKVIFRLRVPLIVSIRVNPKEAYSNTRKYYNLLIRIFYKLKAVNKLVTNSNEIQYLLEKEYGIAKNKLTTIYNGIDIKKIKEFSQDQVDDHLDILKTSDLVKFVNVGRLSDSKNHKLLIEAFSKVYQLSNNTRLIIIGEGDLRSSLEEYVDHLGLSNAIILLGLKENPFPYLRLSNIFVLSSAYEGMPNVILEAMACGLPIISTNIPGAREILDENKYGLLVNNRDVDDLAEKMMRLASDNNLRMELSKKSESRVFDFDYNKIIMKWNSEISTFLL